MAATTACAPAMRITSSPIPVAAAAPTSASA
jgi:hypothetical protein